MSNAYVLRASRAVFLLWLLCLGNTGATALKESTIFRTSKQASLHHMFRVWQKLKSRSQKFRVWLVKLDFSSLVGAIKFEIQSYCKSLDLT